MLAQQAAAALMLSASRLPSELHSGKLGLPSPLPGHSWAASPSLSPLTLLYFLCFSLC